MERQQHISRLFNRYLSGHSTKEELEELLEYFQIEEDRTALTELIAAEMNMTLVDKDKKLIGQIGKNLEKKIFSKTKPKNNVQKLMPWFTAAAILGILSLISIYFFVYREKVTSPDKQLVQKQIEVAPGGENAVLILADGSRINLKDASKGNIAEQSGVVVTKSEDGQLVYAIKESSISNNAAYNTVETPKGGEYQIRLPDGSKVWLNAASSLKYPISFGVRKERKVELRGEAYFEIAHNKRLPFRVATNGQVVEVLGTHFNVNSYSDEGKTITSLQQGSVKVNSANSQAIIKPGQQAINIKGLPIAVKPVDLKQALAWKDGKFKFKDASMPEIMRQIARWYNIEVKYSGPVPNDLFSGTISREANLSEVLQIFEITEVHFKLLQDGNRRTLIINP